MSLHHSIKSPAVLRAARRLFRRSPAATLLMGLLMMAGGPAAAGLGAREYHYQVDLTRNPVEVQARFSIRQDKDFAFMGALGGRPVRDLRVRDGQGARKVSATDDPGIYRVDGLMAGLVEMSYTIPLDDDCRDIACRDDGGVLIMGRDLLVHPMSVDPTFPHTCRLDLLMPDSWTLVTAGGVMESPLLASSLSVAGSWPLLAGDLVVTPMDENELLVVQATGWQVPPEGVGALVAGYLREQNRLLGNWNDDGRQRIVRIVPTRAHEASFGETAPGLDLVRLPGDADRPALAAAMMRPLSDLFKQRLRQGLAGAGATETHWWREGFAEYTTLLAAIRAGSLDEQAFLDRLLAAWLNASQRSPLAQRVSPAQAGALADDDATRYVRDAGLLACFLMDIQIRQATGNSSGLGDLLAATRGHQVTNTLLLREASRLARTDLTDLFQAAVLGTGPAPLPAQASLAGLEMTETGTGELFMGMTLAADEPIITRVFKTGPARARGLKVGDRIVELNGQPVVTTAQVDQTLANHVPGDALAVKVKSADGQSYETVLDLWERVSPTLRRSRKASLAAMNAWSNLVRGEATTFAN